MKIGDFPTKENSEQSCSKSWRVALNWLLLETFLSVASNEGFCKHSTLCCSNVCDNWRIAPHSVLESIYICHQNANAFFSQWIDLASPENLNRTYLRSLAPLNRQKGDPHLRFKISRQIELCTHLLWCVGKVRTWNLLRQKNGRFWVAEAQQPWFGKLVSMILAQINPKERDYLHRRTFRLDTLGYQVTNRASLKRKITPDESTLKMFKFANMQTLMWPYVMRTWRFIGPISSKKCDNRVRLDVTS